MFNALYIVEYTREIAIRLNIVELINIQYVYDGNKLYVIEVNPRASRTVPILSKVTGVPMVKLAIESVFGKKLEDSSFGTGLLKRKNYYVVKVPVFSTEKLTDADIFLRPEMKSTGEVLGVDEKFDIAVYKGFAAVGIAIPSSGTLYVSLNDVDKEEGVDLVREYYKRGFKILVSTGTAKVLTKNNIYCEILKFNELMEMIPENKIDIIINTPSCGNNSLTNGFKIRRKAAEFKVPVFTSIDTPGIFLKAVDVKKSGLDISYNPLSYYINK